MVPNARGESCQCDADGDRFHQVISGVATNFAYATGSNRLMSTSGGMATTYGYNANGNTTTVNSLSTYTYDVFNRLANASGAAFLISAEDQRLRKTFGGNTTYFIPDTSGALLADNQNGTWRDYVWLNGRTVAMMTGGSVYAVHADQTGRAMSVTAPNKSVAWASKNDPFDRSTTTGSAAFFALGFPGQYRDAEDGLWHNGFRDYDAKTGRYIQSDPIGLAGGVNTYAYVRGNPISNSDSLGLCDDHKCGEVPPLPPGADINANIREMQGLRAKVHASGDPFYSALFVAFNDLVGYGGKWDYKTQGPQYENGGNFNYGAAGAAAGFSMPLLRIAAAAAQIGHGSSRLKWVFSSSLGDQPHDVPQILAGISYYNCVASGEP